MKIEFDYKFKDSAERLDSVIMNYLAADAEIELSRSQLKRLIEVGAVTLNEKVVSKAGFPLKSDYKITLELSVEGTKELLPYEFPLDIIYEDAYLLVVNKPAGLVVHPGAGNKDNTLLNAVIFYLQAKNKKDAVVGVPHRLDKDTTGLILVSKNDQIRSQLSQQFSERTTKRCYLALAFSTPRSVRKIQQADSGVINAPIGRHPKKRLQMAIVQEAGREAITNWQVIERYKYATLLELKLETGRTHQIRVHLESVGSPVIGDRTYGDFSGLPDKLRLASEIFGRQALHAQTLGFTHPETKKWLSFDVPAPADFLSLIEEFKAY